MKNTLNTHDITNALLNDKYAAWSYNGAKALAEYLEQYEEDCGIELELDVVAIRCTYTECEDLLEWARSYFLNSQFKELFGDLEEDDLDEEIAQYIEERGQLIEFEGGVIVSEF